MTRPLTLMFIAGEVSGDIHAGRLLQTIKARHPEVQAFGIGGKTLRDAGMEVLVDDSDMAVVGLTEIFKRLWFFKKVFDRMLTEAATRRPDAIILVDYPGFNLRFAARAHALGLKVIYFICPQVWAWNRGRIPRMARVINRLITIFPFEARHFEGTGLKVDYVGHPLVDEAQRDLAAPEPDLPWPGTPHVALLPGSRTHEIEMLLPDMLGAASLVAQRHPGAGFLIPAASPKIRALIEKTIALTPVKPARLAIVDGQARMVLRGARAGLVTSGTATLEAALMRCPNVIIYRVSPLTYFIARRLVKLDHMGIVDIIANKTVCPELIQHMVTPQAMTDMLLPLLDDTPARATMLVEMNDAIGQLGQGGAIERAADAILTELTPATPR